MTRHGFVQILEGERVLERGARADWASPSMGHVLEAPYLGRRSTARGLFARLFSRRTVPCLLPPFGDDGEDVLRLFSKDVPPLGPGDRPEDGVRALDGEATLPGREGEVVLEDFWLTEDRPFRVVELSDFVVAAGDQVIVWCTLAPLVVARPARRSVREHLDRLDPRTRRLVPQNLAADAMGWVVRVEAGARVEVRGVPRPIEQSQHHAELEAWTRGGSRDARRVPARVIGDEDGTRLVMRVVQT
ncbi:MAG: hypothetical protein U0359_39760 [Byssovorax sp.]